MTRRQPLARELDLDFTTWRDRSAEAAGFGTAPTEIRPLSQRLAGGATKSHLGLRCAREGRTRALPVQNEAVFVVGIELV